MPADKIFDKLLNDKNVLQYLSLKHTKINFLEAKADQIQVKWFDPPQQDQLEFLSTQQQILITNSTIETTQFKKNIHCVNQSFYGLYHFKYPINLHVTIEKDFNFFCNRADPIRQWFFYHIILRNWLDRGYISFLCNNSGDPRFSELNQLDVFEQNYQQWFLQFEPEHIKIKDKIPFCNFNENADLSNLILASKFSIVTESHFFDNQTTAFTEKIMRCLQLPRPWVLLTTQHGIQKLRDWGFDVLDDVVNHDYDLIADEENRRNRIIECAEYLISNLDISKILDRCVQAAIHNQKLLESWWNVWFINMDKDFETACQKVSVLQQK